ncbi:MAG: hypothetical protein C0467_22740 [Planctomycetaceae bacterium]|nr:hypothetical protein [Planctomycetaceae bacterium]
MTYNYSGEKTVPGVCPAHWNTEAKTAMLTYKFNFLKTFQAAAVVLRDHDSRMDCVRLLKLLYLADRELLAETGRTLTGDKAVALPRGPVLLTVYDLIKERGPDDEQLKWNAAIQRVKHEDKNKDDDVILTALVPIGRLTKAEESKLHEVCGRYKDTATPELCHLTHDFKEWAEAFEKDEASTINWEIALEAMGLGDAIKEVHLVRKEHDLVEGAFRE